MKKEELKNECREFILKSERDTLEMCFDTSIFDYISICSPKTTIQTACDIVMELRDEFSPFKEIEEKKSADKVSAVVGREELEIFAEKFGRTFPIFEKGDTCRLQDIYDGNYELSSINVFELIKSERCDIEDVSSQELIDNYLYTINFDYNEPSLCVLYEWKFLDINYFNPLESSVKILKVELI